MERRDSPRYEIEVPLIFSGKAVAGGGLITSLSQEGCHVVSEESLAARARLALQIEFPPPYEPMTVEVAEVRWTDATGFDPGMTLAGSVVVTGAGTRTSSTSPGWASAATPEQSNTLSTGRIDGGTLGFAQVRSPVLKRLRDSTGRETTIGMPILVMTTDHGL